MDGFLDLRSRAAQQDPEAIEIGPDGNSLDLLRAVYRSIELPLTTRMRAAMAALKHEVPALAVQALITEQDIATVLDRRIANYERLERERKLLQHNGSKTIEQSDTNPQHTEAQPINGEPQRQPHVETKPPLARTPDRRFRRF